jgi:glycosyltransferase involved in cell wall biosynthesis
MMPFAMNEATEFINPTKALEYMAAGKQIVSTPVPDVVSNFGHVAVVANTAEEFAAACAKALAEPDTAAIERGLKMADENTWDSIVAKMEAHITAAIAARNARLEKSRREAHRVLSRAALAA